MRLVRLVLGTLLVLVALPMLLTGTALWVAMQHRGADGTFSAGLDRIRTDGYAVVVPDVDALLRSEAPFVRGGQTTLRVSAPGRLFLGLAPRADVDRYLAGVPAARLTRGPLPVESTAVSGRRAPAEPPGDLRPWYAVGHQGGGDVTLSWSPSAVRGRHLALVVMNADATPGVDVALTAAVSPRWLNPTAWGLHGAIHRNVRHARCVMHVHSIHATVLASLADSRLPPIDQNSAMFFNRHVVDSHYGGLAFEEEELLGCAHSRRFAGGENDGAKAERLGRFTHGWGGSARATVGHRVERGWPASRR